MSGTSLDGVDAVLVRLGRRGGRLEHEVLARASLDYPDFLLNDLRRCLKPSSSNVRLITQLHTEIGNVYAELVSTVQQKHKVDLVALSGQTVYHIPRVDKAVDKAKGWRTPSTLQLGDADVVSVRCGVITYSDFRRADMAAGGQGAPLVAFADAQLFAKPGVTRSVHNLGGISNLTLLPADGDTDKVIAFDTGPANCLINEAAHLHFGKDLDENGQLAAAGNVDTGVLDNLMTHPYLNIAPPKTTGREVFTLSELTGYGLEGLNPYNQLATLTAFTAHSVAKAYARFAPDADEVIVAGGGALNPVLMQMLRAALDLPVKTFEELGMQSRDREALAFAVLGYYAHFGLANTLPQATGARRAVVAGKRSAA